MKNKIAYLMHVDWNWIKQRPHFLYEQLTRFHEVDLFYIAKIVDGEQGIHNALNVFSPSQVRTLKKLPFSGRSSMFRHVESRINQKVIEAVKGYETIWITSPLLLDFIPLRLLDGKTIIYDCMDDFLGFYKNDKQKKRLRSLEIELIKRATILFTSSFFLRNKIVQVYREFLETEPIVVNNGISSSFMASDRPRVSQNSSEKKGKKQINIVYIGTVGEWFDVKILLKMLDFFPDLIFTIVGPIEVKALPGHSRLKFIGPIGHHELKDVAVQADAMIMPFILNDLVRAIDPVKIYEYIYFGKPIFAVEYEEMYKFLPFVHLYSSEEMLRDLIQELEADKLRVIDPEESRFFLEKNTWEKRTEEIIRYLNAL